MFFSHGLSSTQALVNIHSKQPKKLSLLKRRCQRPQQIGSTNNSQEIPLRDQNQQNQRNHIQTQLQKLRDNQKESQIQQQNLISFDEELIRQEEVLPIVFEQALKNLRRTQVTRAEKRAFVQLEKNWYNTIHSLMNLSDEEAILLEIPLRLTIELRKVAGDIYLNFLSIKQTNNQLQQQQLQQKDAYKKIPSIQENQLQQKNEQLGVSDEIEADQLKIEGNQQKTRDITQKDSKETQGARFSNPIQQDNEVENSDAQYLVDDKEVQGEENFLSEVSDEFDEEYDEEENLDPGVFPGSQFLEQLGRDMEQCIGPLPDNWKTIKLKDRQRWDIHQNILISDMDIDFDDLPPEIQEQIQKFTDTLSTKFPYKVLSVKSSLAQMMHYLHIKKQKLWAQIQLRDLVPKSGNQIFQHFKDVISWICQSKNISYYVERNLIISATIITEKYFPDNSLTKEYTRFWDQFEKLRRMARKRRDVAVCKVSPRVFLDIAIMKRLRICGKRRPEKHIAWAISCFLQYVLSLAFFEENAYALKVDDVRKVEDKFQVYVGHKWHEIPEYFTQYLDLYVFQHRDVLDPQLDDFFVRTNGQKVRSGMIIRCIQRPIYTNTGIFLCQAEIRKIVQQYQDVLSSQ